VAAGSRLLNMGMSGTHMTPGVRLHIIMAAGTGTQFYTGTGFPVTVGRPHGSPGSQMITIMVGAQWVGGTDRLWSTTADGGEITDTDAAFLSMHVPLP
jgi:hypothetical protein